MVSTSITRSQVQSLAQRVEACLDDRIVIKWVSGTFGRSNRLKSYVCGPLCGTSRTIWTIFGRTLEMRTKLCDSKTFKSRIPGHRRVISSRLSAIYLDAGTPSLTITERTWWKVKTSCSVLLCGGDDQCLWSAITTVYASARTSLGVCRPRFPPEQTDGIPTLYYHTLSESGIDAMQQA